MPRFARLLLLTVALLVAACTAPRQLTESAVSDIGHRGGACFDWSVLPPEDRAYADSLLAYALDHEGLYTIAAPIKPMSSVASLDLPVARPDTLPEGVRGQVPPGSGLHLARAARFHRVAATMRCGSVEAIVVPYRKPYEGERILQMSVVDRDRLDILLARDAAFWGQWGLTPGADPHLVATIVENETATNRWRGYGYLFGYPEYAVTFFTEAGRHQEETGDFVERDFFHIPVHGRPTGHFTYAIPRDHTPTEVDSVVYREAAEVLQRYRAVRPDFLRADSTLRAAELLRSW